MKLSYDKFSKEVREIINRMPDELVGENMSADERYEIPTNCTYYFWVQSYNLPNVEEGRTGISTGWIIDQLLTTYPNTMSNWADDFIRERLFRDSETYEFVRERMPDVTNAYEYYLWLLSVVLDEIRKLSFEQANDLDIKWAKPHTKLEKYLIIDYDHRVKQIEEIQNDFTKRYNLQITQ